jgi:hypothetical protein
VHTMIVERIYRLIYELKNKLNKHVWLVVLVTEVL